MVNKDQWPSDPPEIKRYLIDLWKQCYPEQGRLPFYYNWIRKSIPISHIIYGNPHGGISREKVSEFVKLLFSGVSLPPVVCLYGELIDGYHRYHAHKELGLFSNCIDVYMNR